MEGDHVEFKEGVGQREIHEAAVSFSNSDGGVLLLGVNNDGRVVGRPFNQGVTEGIRTALSPARNLGPVRIAPTRVDGREITVVSIGRCADGFAQTSDGNVLVRRGPGKAALFGAELVRFLAGRSTERFESGDGQATIDGADAGLIAELAGAYGWRQGEELYTRLEEQGLVLPSSGGRLTVAGTLFLLPEPSVRRMGKAHVELLRFEEGSRDYTRRVEIRGPIHRQIELATNAVLDELGVDVIVIGLRRHEVPRLPRVVVREAIANAVAHRSYQRTGNTVRIEVRRESVTVISPGGFPEGVTSDNIREAQAARNVDVLRVLRHLRLAEDVGRGVDVMQDEMHLALLDPPVFKGFDDRVVVTLPLTGRVSQRERAWLLEVEQRGIIQPSDRLLLVAAARGERLTNQRARTLLGVDSVEARRALAKLCDKGFLVREGSRGGAVYVLHGSLEPPAGLRLSQPELEDLILEAAVQRALSNADVRERTGLDRVEVLGLLDGLVRQGRLMRVGSKRGTRYMARG